MNTTPYLSLCVICGDEGTKTLGRLLDSVLLRKTPLVDEIIIGFNGKDTPALAKALKRYLKLGDLPSKWSVELGAGNRVLFTVFSEEWKKDFSAARNATWAHAQGEWVIWLDTDDIFSDPSDETSPDGLIAIERCERDYGLPPAPRGAAIQTLKQYLQGLPAEVNTILVPYDYMVNESGDVLVRQIMKRIVRRSAGHVWRNAIHEGLYPSGAVGERAVQNLGLLVRHHPSEDVKARVARNRDIVLAMEARPEIAQFADARHYYDLANAHLTLGDFAKADIAIRQAIARSQSDLDTYTYRLARSSILKDVAQHDAALSEALAAIGLRPEVQDAYFMASEMYFILGKMSAVVKFFELGTAQPPILGQKDQPLALWVSPRAQAALAYLNMGQNESALKVATEAFARYPDDPLAKEALQRAQYAVKRERAFTGLLDTIEYAIEQENVVVAENLFDIVHSEAGTAFRGFEKLPRTRALEARLEVVGPDAEYLDLHPLDEDEMEEGRKLLAESGGASDAGAFLFSGGSGQRGDEVGLHMKVIATGEQLFAHKPYKNGQLAIVSRLRARGEVTFYCPHAVENWVPSDLERKGLGGSESSVAHLSRALAKMGYRPTVYAPGGSSTPMTVRGVTELNIAEFKPAEAEGALIACRAPWVMRQSGLDAKVPVFAWHQDNGYGNSWLWNKEVDALLKGSLHVSAWARNELLKELNGGEAPAQIPASHHVIGNGIDESCLSWLKNENHVRHSNRVIYASDPTRGLAPLLLAWPKVRGAIPDAELHIFCGFRVMLTLAAASPGLPGLREMQELEQLMLNIPGVNYRGWAPQPQLIAELQAASVYAYPGGPMPEGFGVSLVQAAAAGCTMVFPHAGALPEVLGNSAWCDDDALKLRIDVDYLADKIVHALKYGDGLNRKAQAEAMYELHGWPTVAKRFLKAVFR